jgi:hypothetical protein
MDLNLQQWLDTRSWDFYRFASPLASLIVQYASSTLNGGLAGEVERELMREGLTEAANRNDFVRFAKDWHLQISYFVAFPTTVISLATIIKPFSGGGPLFALSVLLLVLASIWLFPKIFKQQPGTISMLLTESGANSFLKRKLYKWKWSYADFYSRLLRLVNVILILLTFITMPAKP